MCATSHPGRQPDRHRDPEGRRQRGRCGHRHRRRAGRRRMPHDRDRRRLLCHRRQARRKKPIALNAAGRAPKAATADWYAKKGIKRIETTSVHAVTVPGAIDGWCRLLEDHGTMPLDRLLAPAIELAEARLRGRPARRRRLGAGPCASSPAPGPRRTCCKGGRPPEAGEVMRFPALAATLAAHRQGGRDGFYAGEVAKDMVAELKALGGLHTLDDFAAQASSASYVEPISVAYRGVDVKRAAPQQPGHRRADHAQDAGAARQAARRSRLGRALSRADGGGAAGLSPCAIPSSPIPTWPTCPSSTCSTTR